MIRCDNLYPILADNCECGIKNPDIRIVGGEETGPHEYPWQVALVYAYSNYQFCGGTIINERFVMVARWR